MMPELLGRHTKMEVVQVEDGMEVQPDHVYVIPPNADLAILHGRLQVLEPSAPRGLRMPIDFFFRQLAADQRERAIGIILSGMGSDGTLGLKAIKETSEW
jgi:two-component system CheB/CheR fusion protein